MNVAESMGTAQCLHSSMISAGRAPFTSVHGLNWNTKHSSSST
jgi:hypothetical protein